MIQIVALGIVGIYLVMVAIAGNVQPLFGELVKETAFSKWLIALVGLKFLGDRFGDKFGDGLVSLVFLSMFLSQSGKIGNIGNKITGFFYGQGRR